MKAIGEEREREEKVLLVPGVDLGEGGGGGGLDSIPVAITSLPRRQVPQCRRLSACVCVCLHAFVFACVFVSS